MHELRALARLAVACYRLTREQPRPTLAAIAAALAEAHGLDAGDELADAVQVEYARAIGDRGGR